LSSLDRRAFLARSAAALGTAGTAAAAIAAGSSAAEADTTASPLAPGAAAAAADLTAAEPFAGVHQAGILTPAPAHATFAALDSFAPDQATLISALAALSHRADALAVGGAVPRLELDAPPADSGILGPGNQPDRLTITISFGASLFDGRYGLAPVRPKELTQMPSFAIDALDPARSHGDVLLQICAQHRDTVVHTLRELLRTVRGSLQVRWTIDGFAGADRGPSPRNSPRNLFAFRDGTANPDTTDAGLMNRLVWVSSGAGEPAWAVGGTYQVVRVIRMHVEFWDRVGLFEQQTMIGRDRDTGAPLGAQDEFDDPRYDLDPKGERIPLTAHIRLSNPRTPETADQRILRRGFNYHRGVDAAGQLDQGLIFCAFNQSPSRQFVTIQNRLLTEPMIDYITPVGGGYFFVPPGATGSQWAGSGMFRA
jgi:deferrochelatase/peroxidase EfeB